MEEKSEMDHGNARKIHRIDVGLFRSSSTALFQPKGLLAGGVDIPLSAEYRARDQDRIDVVAGTYEPPGAS